MANPLLSRFTTPFGVPPFNKIRDHHFEPAIRAGIKLHRDEIRTILENTDPPSFDNTIAAMENAGWLLRQTTAVLYNLAYAHTRVTLQNTLQKVTPALSAHNDSVFMNPVLFDRVASVWYNRKTLRLRGEKRRLTRMYFLTFTRNGAGLSARNKKRIAAINQQLSLLSLNFGRKILDTTNRYKLVIEHESQLSGLPQPLRDAAATAAQEAGHNGKWMFTLHNASVIPFLQYADNRNLRHEIWNAFVNKGDLGDDLDTAPLIQTMVALRAEKAKILGFKEYASYILDEQMAKSPAQVDQLLHRLWIPALHTAREEADALQAYIKKENQPFTLKPWDWRYYAEKIRRDTYGLDENELRPYFPLENVQKGVFGVAQQLYQLHFQEEPSLPVYHPDVKAYRVSDTHRKDIGILYLDFFPRESKQGGAWMTSFAEQHYASKKRIIPVISIVCNFTPPIGDLPALLTLDEVNTLFHEFGHALHGLLSNVKYRSLAGTNVATDFVELPSQIMENWCMERDVLTQYATHYKTGEAIPPSLIDRIEKAARYGQGFATVEYLAASFLDMAYHTLPDGRVEDVTAFEKSVLDTLGLLPEISPRYRSTCFSHIFAGGYACGYYSYIWSEVLDADAYALFTEKGIFDAHTASSFRRHILEKGGSDEGMRLYRRFRGRKPDIDALLQKRGLTAAIPATD